MRYISDRLTLAVEKKAGCRRKERARVAESNEKGWIT